MGAFFNYTKRLKEIVEALKQSYALDLRALGIMRIGIGLILLTDLFIRSLSINAFFTDDGLLPLHILKQYNWNPVYFSLHAISGSIYWQIGLFIINAACVVLLIVGYRTRLFTFICWVFLTSIQNRNPFILQGGDDLLRLILLWGMFLPWGERYTVNKTSIMPNQYISLANVGYMMLVMSVYFFSALLKESPEWHSEGSALYYALSIDQIRLPLGTIIYQYPGLLKILTYLVYYIELIPPLLFVLPFLSPKIRLIGVVSIAALHLGIASTLYVGLFYSIGLTTLIGMLPSTVMDWFEKKFYKNRTEYIEISEPANQLTQKSISKFLKNALVSLIIIYCLMANLGSVRKFPFVLDEPLITFGHALRLEQNWGMFAPYILKDDGFYIYAGHTVKDYKYIDIARGGKPVSYEKPKSIVSEFESDRWRKLAENYTFNTNNHIRPYLCKYLLRKWNEDHPENKIQDLTIFFMKERTLPNYKTEPLQKNPHCQCYDK